MFEKLLRKTELPRSKYPVKPAFIVDGVQYYQFEDPLNVPYERGLKTVTFYEEVKMKITYDYLMEHSKAVATLFADPKKIDLFAVKRLNDILIERLALAYDTEILYKLASIVYFDDKEDFTTYDFTYGQKKIDLWKKKMGLKEFFSQKPIVELMPFLKDADENFEMYSLIVQQINAQHSDYVSSIRSTK